VVKFSPKTAIGNSQPGQVLLPNAIVLDGVAVDGFVLASVNGKVGLTVAVQVERAQGDAPLDGLLKDPVVTLVPCQVTSRGRPVFTETSFMIRRPLIHR